MNNKKLNVALVLIMVGSIAAPLAAGSAPPTIEDQSADGVELPAGSPANNSTVERAGLLSEELTQPALDQDLDPADPTSERRTIVIETAPNQSDRVVRGLRSLGVEPEVRVQDSVQTTVDPTKVPEIRQLPGVGSVQSPIPVVAADTGSSNSTTAATDLGDLRDDEVHDAGITGDGIRIGVIDPEGFAVNSPDLDGKVVATKSYKGGISNGGDHGTDVARAAVDTAPDAGLLLSNVETSSEVVSAIEWMRSKDVDIIVASFGTPTAPDNGEYKTTEAFDDAVNDGIFVATSTGNDRFAHWRGQWQDSDGDGVLEFGQDDETNEFRLSKGQQIGIGLTWSDFPETDEDYNIYLRDGSGTIIEKSTQTQDGNDPPRESIWYTAPADGKYSVVIKAPSGGGQSTLDLVVDGALNIEYNIQKYSITAPATGRKVTAVGEYEAVFDRIAGTSSQGPTEDGRRGVNVLSVSGQDGIIGGTSGAAPRVGATAALMLAADGSLSVDEVEQTLEDTATDVGPDGVDLRAGYGVIDSYRAVDAVADLSGGGGGGGGSATFGVSSLQVPDSVESDTSFSVSATVENTGDASGSQTVQLLVDNTVEESRTVSLDSGQQTDLSWTLSGLSSGDHTIIVSTDDDGQSRSVSVSSPSTNDPPQADAGENQRVDGATEVTLDATGSSDPNGDSLSYQWEQTGGPNVSLSTAGSATATFTAPEVNSETTLSFKVTVDDGNATATDTVTITIRETNKPPEADAGADKTVEASANDVSISASGSSDPNGDSLSYQWEQVSGPDVLLLGQNNEKASFPPPEVNSETTLTFEVTVDDGEATDTDTVNITVKPQESSNSPPTADAGADQTVTAGGEVALDATGSSDPDGDSLSFAWTQTGGTSVSLSGSSTATPTFTAPSVDSSTTLTFEVVVDDGQATATDSVTVTVERGSSGSDRISRRVSASRATPGSEVEVTLSYELDQARDSVSIQDNFEGPIAGVGIEEVRINGSSASGSVVVSNADVDNGATVALQDVSTGATVEVVYAVDVAASASTGATIELTGTDGPDVAAGDFDGSFGTDTVTIRESIPAKRSVSTEVQKGSATTVTLSVDLSESYDGVSIQDSFEGPISSASIEEVRFDGEPAPSGSIVVTQASADAGVTAALRDVSAGTTVEVEYTVTVSSEATVGDSVTFSGTDGPDVAAGDFEAEFGSDLATVVEGGIIARFDQDGNGKISTEELNAAIQAWATGEISTEELNTVIQEWAISG